MPFFNRIIRQRLLSLLNPWLLEEPQLDLQLGFLNSLAVATNLRFDVSVLNQLFDSPSRLFLKDLTVERLTVKFSTWHAPAFTIEVHGVRLVQSFEKPEEDGCHERRSRPSKYDYSDYIRKNLSVLDPEGCSLHHILERILFAVPERRDFTESFLNLILKNCHLEAHRIHVEVQFPILSDEFMCFGEIKEFSARSKYLDKKCLFRGFLSTIFIPMKESSYVLDGIGFRIGFIGKNHTDRVLLSSDMHSFIKLRYLKLADYSLCFPELAFSFSPDDISVCLIFDKLLSDKYNQTRSGRELWRIAASRIGHVTVTPRLSLQRLVGVIGQWIHYVNAYENMLLLAGYSTGHIWKKSISEMSKNKLILSSARYHWEVISEIEKKLPAEGIALARRIARHRAALKVPSDCDEECVSPSNFFRPFLFILALMWKLISKIIHCIVSIFFGKKVVQDPDSNGCLGSLTEDPCQRCCFVLNFGKIIMTVSQINEIQPSVYEKLQSHTGIAYSDFLSICFSIDALVLVSVKDIFEQSVTVSCGQMKVEPAPWTVSAEANTMNMLSADKGIRNEGTNVMESILWVEPAKIFLPSETTAAQTEDSCDSHIGSFMGKLYVSWKGICGNFNESDIEYSENPCLLCKVEISSTYPDHKNPDFGFCECGLMLGKLNLVLTHSSISSVSLLLSQVQHAICWEERRETSIASNFVDKTENAWVNKYEFYSKGLIMALLQKLPEKHIHFGVFVDGPCVRFSHRSEANLGGQGIIDIAGQDNFDLAFDFHEIEVAFGSPSLFGMAPFTCQLGLDDAKAECITLEPHVIEIPKPNSDKYASSGKISLRSYLHLNGINACLEKSTEKHQIQLFVLEPITVQILSFRDYIYSLSTTMSAFSAAVDIIAGRFTALSFLDEVYMIHKAVASLSSVVSYLFTSFDEVDCIYREIMKREAFFAEPDSSEGTIRGALLTNNMFPFFIKGTCRFKSIDVILGNSRTIDNVESSTTKFDFLTGNKRAVQKLPDCGIWISIQQTTIVISCEEGKMDLLTDLSGIMSSVFKYQNSIGNNNDHILLENLLLRSVNCLHEISLSGCKFTLCLGFVQSTSSSGNESKTLGSSNSDGNISYVARETNLTVYEVSNNQSPHLVKKMGSPVNICMPASASHWLLINIAVTNAFIGRCSMKSNLVLAHQSNELLSSLSIGGEFQMISWEIQGGFIVLETASLGMAIDNYSSYLHYIGNLTSDAQQSNKGIKKGEHVNESYILNDENDQGNCTSQQAESALPDAFDLSLSHSALVFALENESGGIQEIVLEVGIHLKFELATTGRKLTLDLSHLSILSQIIHEKVEHETAIPHFSSVTSKDLSPHLASADHLSGLQNFSEFNSVRDASSSRDPVPVQLSHQNQILKDLRASMSLERPDNGSLHLSRCWFGIGSLSGFNMTLSLSEIQTILSMASSLSGVSSQNTTKELERNHWSTSHEVDNSLETLIPNGAIVAIQDVNQHMYFAVEGEQKTFSIGGVIHYSLVGERALFRVKHCTQRRWNSTVLWFSLISLFARSDMGVPLRLNCRPGSCFVDISCTNDGGCALWRVYPPHGESYEGVTDWEACNQPVKRTFYLVNKKNNSAVAFVDGGAPEFVKKPGSLIKFKVFQDLSVAPDVSETASCYPGMALQTSLHTNEESISFQGGKLPCIDIKIEEISLNFVHELSNTEDLFPLICVLINKTQLTIQSLATKSRVIGTSSAVVNYFDAQRNLWGELIHPIEICIFYRSDVQTQLSEYASRAVPVNYFCRVKELDVSLSENSLDVLLFMIGKLNLSGPYSLRSSMVFANCCKVENESGLNLLLHVNQQRMTIPRKQSASILLRNQESEAATSVSIRLAEFGSFATSSVHILLSQMQILAWRTRIMSNEGSISFPGPMLVVSVFRNSEVGLSVVVSPLIRIHNETGFSMELQFQRPDPKDDEFASVLLKPGDSIDDSMAMFDAINFSGGVKRALTSLGVGMQFHPHVLLLTAIPFLITQLFSSLLFSTIHEHLGHTEKL